MEILFSKKTDRE